MLRTSTKPLQQIIRRISEKQFESIHATCTSPKLRYEHNDGPILQRLHGTQYKQVVSTFGTIKLDDNNSICTTQDGTCIKIVNIINSRNGIFLIGKQLQFAAKRDFFTYPCKSSLIGINVASKLSPHMIHIPISQVTSKCPFALQTTFSNFSTFTSIRTLLCSHTNPHICHANSNEMDMNLIFVSSYFLLFLSK